jgi:hypothetical protein
VLFKFEGYAGSYPYAGLVRDPGGISTVPPWARVPNPVGLCSSSILIK